MRSILFCLGLVAVLAGAPAPQGRPIQRELLQVPTRKGVTQSALLLTEGSAPRAVALLFPGGAGAVGLGRRSPEAVLGPRGNFLTRGAEQLLSPELAVLILDCPSDRSLGMEDEFRASDAHAEDVRGLLGVLKARFKGLRAYLVGTSRGTVSAAYVAQTLGAEVDGVVLTSTVFNANKRYIGLSLFHFEQLKGPLLLVHHAEDGCPVCPYSAARALAGRAALITVRGSIEPETGACDPLSNHGFFGREAPVTRAIRGWILGEPYEKEIP